MTKRIVMPVVDIWHEHLREGQLMYFIIDKLIENGYSGRVLAEPNTTEPLLYGYQAKRYVDKINSVFDLRRLSMVDKKDHKQFEVVPTIQITENTTPQMVYEAYELGIRVAKVYPRYVTTNSSNGVVDYIKIYPALKAAEDCGMIIQFHGEHPSQSVEGPEKEQRFIEDYLDPIVQIFTKLKVSLEHISTAFAVDWVERQNPDPNIPPRIVGALAPQHMRLTSDDTEGYTEASGYKGQTNLICKPKLKWNKDRLRIQEAATSGKLCFVFGPDGAAHCDSYKGPGLCNCGVFNETESLASNAEIFEARGALEKMHIFYDAGRQFYGYPKNEGAIELVKCDWVVPKKYEVTNTRETVTPMLPGQTLHWKVVGWFYVLMAVRGEKPHARLSCIKFF